MTACFKLVKTLQKSQKQQAASFCEPCVYFSGNLDPLYSSSNGLSCHACGLDFVPGSELCKEMRTDNCSTRKSAD